jgi:exonuclease SbcC
VAIAGANGRGKTTIMDNLHPYLVMPSRAGGDGLGALTTLADASLIPRHIRHVFGGWWPHHVHN